MARRVRRSLVLVARRQREDLAENRRHREVVVGVEILIADDEQAVRSELVAQILSQVRGRRYRATKVGASNFRAERLQ